MRPKPTVPAHGEGNESSGPVQSRLRAIDGLARLSNGDPVGAVAQSVGYASPSAFTAR